MKTAIIAFTLGFFILTPIEYWKRNRRQPFFRRSKLTDTIHFFVNKIVLDVGFNLLIWTGAWIGLHHTGPGFMSPFPVVYQVVVLFLVAEFGYYWAHRLSHEIPVLWKFHEIHHSAEQLDWLVAGRIHPVNFVWDKAFTLTPVFLLGFSPAALGLYVFAVTSVALLTHANLRFGLGFLESFLISPRYHHLHHSSDIQDYDKNYGGVLTIWDRVFKTASNSKSFPSQYGVESNVPKDYLAQIRYPFRRWASSEAEAKDNEALPARP